jgi:hypothetical protein
LILLQQQQQQQKGLGMRNCGVEGIAPCVEVVIT